jgi:hypothetical protein
LRKASAELSRVTLLSPLKGRAPFSGDVKTHYYGPKDTQSQGIFKAYEKKLLARLEEILNRFIALDQVQFDLFKPEARTKARATLPHSFLL